MLGQRRLSRQIRRGARAGTHMPAVVVDVFFNRVSARLSSNGAIVRNLPVVGGPVDVGDTVFVDYTTPEPTAVAIGKEWLTQDDLDRALSRLSDTGATGKLLLAVDLFQGGSLYKTYIPDTQGFGQALSDAASGDTVHYNNCKVTGDFTVPGDVHLVGLDPVNSIIYGKLTLEEDASVSNIRIQNTGSSGSEMIGIEGPSSGFALVEDSHIFVINCGSADAIGISCDNPAANMIVRDCIVHVEAEVGDAYAIRGP